LADLGGSGGAAAGFASSAFTCCPQFGDIAGRRGGAVFKRLQLLAQLGQFVRRCRGLFFDGGDPAVELPHRCGGIRCRLLHRRYGLIDLLLIVALRGFELRQAIRQGSIGRGALAVLKSGDIAGARTARL